MPNASLLQFTGLTSLLIVRRQLYAPVPLDLLFLFVNPLKFDRLFFIFWAFSFASVMWGKTYTRRRRARDVRRAAERAGARRDAERAVVAGTVHATEDEAISASG